MGAGVAGGASAALPNEAPLVSESHNREVEDHAGPLASEKLTADEVATVDATAYAGDHGTTVVEARERLLQLKTIGDVFAALKARFPSTFAGGWIKHEPALEGVARFKGVVPVDARDVVDACQRDSRCAGASPGSSWTQVPGVTHVALVTVVGGAARSLAELSWFADVVHADIVAQWDTSVVTSYDVSSGGVEVSIETPLHLRDLSDAELRHLLPPSAKDAAVTVMFSIEPVAGDEHTYGGAKTPYDGGSGYCTTAFAVVKSGTRGFLTAGHCSNDRSYQQPSDGATYNAPYQSQHRGDWGDYQWHTTGHAEYAEFYSSSTHRRDVINGQWNIEQGDYLCVYGRRTGYSCSDVYRTSVTNTFDGFTHKRLVAMEEHETDGGDSGGPWFIGERAAGTHSGWKTIWWKKRSTFSRIGYMDEALGLSLLVK